jgi:hypothetical protein
MKNKYPLIKINYVEIPNFNISIYSLFTPIQSLIFDTLSTIKGVKGYSYVSSGQIFEVLIEFNVPIFVYYTPLNGLTVYSK